MLIVVVIIFTLCWAPYHGYFLVTYHYPDIVRTQYVQHIYLVIYFVAMSNSVRRLASLSNYRLINCFSPSRDIRSIIRSHTTQ